MKIHHLTMLLLLVSTSTIAQIPANAIALEDVGFNNYYQNQEHIPVVKGRILNLPENEMRDIKISYSIVMPFIELQTTKNCRPNPDGSFELELDYAFPYQQIWLSIGEIFFAGIYAHKDLFIELDAAKIEAGERIECNGDAVKYLGNDGELNVYLNNHVLFKWEEQIYADARLFSLIMNEDFNQDTFIMDYDNIYATLNWIDSEYIKQNPSKYSWLILNERQSQYYGEACFKLLGKQIPPAFYAKIKNHKAYLTSNSGMQFNKYFFYYISFGVKKDTYHEYALHVTKILDSLLPQSKSDLLKLHIASKNLDTQKVLMDVVLKNVKTDWCRKVIQLQYESDLAKSQALGEILKNPNESDALLGQFISETPFGAKLYKVDTLRPETLLANLKTAHSGKALIIDFWATWCLPCLREMPHSKNLQNETSELPIAFVYLCTSRNSDIETWRAKITELEIGGTHIFVDYETESRLMTLFSVSGFPSYVFIDQNGTYKAGAISNMSDLDKQKLAKMVE